MPRLVLLILLLCCQACSYLTPNNIRCKIIANANINADAKHQALPVVVKMYQLNDLHYFETATFQELWKKDREHLASSLLNQKEIIVPPKSTHKFNWPRDEKAKYLAVFVSFKHPDDGKWRTYQQLAGNVFSNSFKGACKISLTDNTVSIK